MPPVVTTTSSNEADEYAVCSPIRPADGHRARARRELCPVDRAADRRCRSAVMDSVYQVPLATVRDELPSTVTELPLTACSSTRPGSRARR